MDNAKTKKAGPISLYPLKFEEIVRDVLTIKPPPKPKRKTRSKAR